MTKPNRFMVGRWSETPPTPPRSSSQAIPKPPAAALDLTTREGRAALAARACALATKEGLAFSVALARLVTPTSGRATP